MAAGSSDHRFVHWHRGIEMGTDTDNNEKNLRRLPIDCLWEGLIIKDNIYNHTGETLLLPKGEQLTADTIRRLYNFNKGDQSIMIYEEVYYDILTDEHISPQVRQKLTESSSGYSKLAQNVGGMLHHVDAWLQNDQLEQLVQEISDKLVAIDPVTIFSCINFPRPMDEGLQRHSLNVAYMNGMMGRWLELPEKDIRTLVMAGLLHDIGKTKIPEEILNADRQLTPEEFEVMKQHPVYSYEMLGEQFNEVIRDTVRHHHEKLNGQGYPDGLREEQISLYTRITSLSDIYDAMVSERSYKGAELPFHVFDMFYKGEFQGLDRTLVMVFLKHIRRHFVYSRVIMSDGKVAYIRYIPINDAQYPIVEQNGWVTQTDDNWYCREMLTL